VGILLGLSLLVARPALADPYTSPPGNTPKVGAVDAFTPAGNGVQVLGQTFTRTANGGFLASTGADIAELTLIGLGLVTVGVVLVRRRRPRHPRVPV
jgi:LPXTG-motif cell wall-anchored protein